MLTDILEGIKEAFPRGLDKYVPNIGLAFDVLSGGAQGFLVTAVATYQKYQKNFQATEQYKKAQKVIFVGSILLKIGWEVFELSTGRVDPHIPMNLVHSALQTAAWAGGAYVGTFMGREQIKDRYDSLRNKLTPSKD